MIVEAPDGVLLLPVPEDPVRDLEELGEPIRGMSLEAVKQRIRRRARVEVTR